MGRPPENSCQMNVRIDNQVRKEGNAVFAALGMTPSQAVRAFYVFAIRNRYDTDRIISVLEESPGNDEAIHDAKPSRAVEMRSMREALDRSRGIPKKRKGQDNSPIASSDEDLIASELLARMTERGLA